MGLPACVGNIEDDGVEGTTGGVQPDACFAMGECNGVKTYCWNDNEQSVDETGADDGAVPNYWYDVVPQTYCVQHGGVAGMLDGVPYCQFFQIPETPHGAAVEVCVGDDSPAEIADGLGPLDPTAWAADGFPSIDDAIRTECSTKCMGANDNTVDFNPVCQDANWSAVQTAPSWTQSTGFNCVVDDPMNDLDPDGSEVPWELAGGTSTSLPLSCALDDDCVDWFYPHVGAWILTPGIADFIEPETRRAHYLGVEGSGSQLELDMSGSGAGVDDTEPVYGMAEYTALDCGSEDVCPFFLANLSAYNTTETWEVRVQTVGGRLAKSISDVQVDLLQSTLGVYNEALDVVAFAPGSLRLRAQFTVGSCPTCDHTGDGIHAFLVENDEYVFAAYDAGELTISHEFTMQSGGVATLTVTVVPDERPPTAAHDLQATEWADDPPNGLILDASRSLSSDPDSDIEIEFWWVDGDPVGHGSVIPYGSHLVAIEARDARGAVHRSNGQWVLVADPT